MVHSERPEEISRPEMDNEATIASQRLLESADSAAMQSRQGDAPAFDMGKLRALGASVGFTGDTRATEISRIPVGLGQNTSSGDLSARVTPELGGPAQSYVFASKRNYYQVRQHRLAEQSKEA